MSIIVNNVTKVFGQQYALNKVSFEAKKGEIVGFLGPNGAGKTTMMKIITGLIPPTEGEVTVCGLDIWKDSLKLRQIIGYLSEANPLYYDMYVREFLEFVAGVFHLKDKKKFANLSALSAKTAPCCSPPTSCRRCRRCATTWSSSTKANLWLTP